MSAFNKGRPQPGDGRRKFFLLLIARGCAAGRRVLAACIVATVRCVSHLYGAHRENTDPILMSDSD